MYLFSLKHFIYIYHPEMGEQQSELDKEENDQIIKVLGHFGKWQLYIILPSAFLRIVIAWELFVSSISLRSGKAC